MQVLPFWRSLLFLPTHNDKFVEKAHTRGADAYILDLEDSVPIELKVTTRKKSQSSGIKLIAKWCRCAGQN